MRHCPAGWRRRSARKPHASEVLFGLGKEDQREVLKLGINVMPSRLTQACNTGDSSQLPAGIVLNVGTRRIARKLNFGGKMVL